MNANILHQSIITRPARRNRRRGLAVAALATALLVPFAASKSQQIGVAFDPPAAFDPPVVEVNASEPTRDQIARQVLDAYAGNELKGEVRSRLINSLRNVYDARNYEPVWNDGSAAELREVVADYMPAGLDIYPVTLEFVDRLVAARTSSELREAAEADMELTSIFIRLAWQVNGGLSEEGEVVVMSRSKLSPLQMSSLVDVAGNGKVRSALRVVEYNRG